MLTNEQAATIDYMSAKGLSQIFVRPETQLGLECAKATLTPHQYESFSATPEQLAAYYEMKNRRCAEMIAA